MEDNLNPNWTRKMEISDKLKFIKIAVFDQDSSSKKTSVKMKKIVNFIKLIKE